MPGCALRSHREECISMSAHRVMNLQAALRTLEEMKPDEEAAKLRRFARFTSRGEARLWPGQPCNNPGGVSTVHIRDISRGGIGVLSSSCATVGTPWQVQMGDLDVVIATIPGFCRHCSKIMEGAYFIGIQFGIDTSVLLALGVSHKLLASGDMPDTERIEGSEFCSPEEQAREAA
jgi:hypothetical protein